MTVAPFQDHLMAESPLSKTIGKRLKIVPVTNIASTRFSTGTYYNTPYTQQWHLMVQQLNGKPHNFYLTHQTKCKNGKPPTQGYLDFLETLYIDPEKQDETKW